MIDLIPDLPANVLGFTAKGTVTARDYEAVIIPAVEAMFARHNRGRLLYHLGNELAGFEAAAMWDDAMLGFKHLTGWEKIAVVSDVEWIRAAIKAFSLLIPGHIRVFHNHEFVEAKQWVSH